MNLWSCTKKSSNKVVSDSKTRLRTYSGKDTIRHVAVEGQAHTMAGLGDHCVSYSWCRRSQARDPLVLLCGAGSRNCTQGCVFVSSHGWTLQLLTAASTVLLLLDTCTSHHIQTMSYLNPSR